MDTQGSSEDIIAEVITPENDTVDESMSSTVNTNENEVNTALETSTSEVHISVPETETKVIEEDCNNKNEDDVRNSVLATLGMTVNDVADAVKEQWEVKVEKEEEQMKAEISTVINSLGLTEGDLPMEEPEAWEKKAATTQEEPKRNFFQRLFGLNEQKKV